MASRSEIPPPKTNNVWYKFHRSSSVIVFVHGIFSDSRDCWMSDDTYSYWPKLVTEDNRLQDTSVFLGGYYTAIDSGRFDIADCAKDLFSGLTIPDSKLTKTPIEHGRIVFVCHSTGGIIVRYMLEKHAVRFANKEIGLLLIASPSYGSKLADKLGGLADFYDNQLGKHLRWGNDLLKDLDDRFKTLLDDKPYQCSRGWRPEKTTSFCIGSGSRTGYSWSSRSPLEGTLP